MVAKLCWLIAGLFVWTFLEYLIHGWLSHRFDSFARPLHAVHHHDPKAVFTVGAWVPVAAIWVALASVFGWAAGVICVSGAVAGFVVYEAVHYRLHFCRPRGRFEAYLRSRHLVHHELYPDRCFSVTSPLWDLVFGTEPLGAEILELRQSLISRPPLSGPTNIYKLSSFLLPANWRKKTWLYGKH
jgi:sterol desaturase/sphingolipid hydroxylase (fatty acid hydroxylase superfamily)